MWSVFAFGLAGLGAVGAGVGEKADFSAKVCHFLPFWLGWGFGGSGTALTGWEYFCSGYHGVWVASSVE